MRFISKSSIVINTESLFTLTSKWHHYPLALTCFLGFGANTSKMKRISVSSSSGFSLEPAIRRLPASFALEAELHAVESFSLRRDCVQCTHGTHAFNQAAAGL